jgi:creatinine amidohydrolase
MQGIEGMSIHDFADMTWEEVERLDRSEPIAILPVGALEAHGPHLPLATDVIISEAMARSAAAKLAARGHEVLILPPLAYTAAEFAAEFRGTISLSPQTVTRVIVDVARSLSRQRCRALVLANSHLDPAHLASLREAERESRSSGLPVIFPDLTKKPWALRLTEEFKSGACHAGRFETSVVQSARPDLVKEEIRETLPANPASLTTAIRNGKRTFHEAGGPRAYFGSPAEATATEGVETIEILGAILEEATLAGIASGS